MTVTAAVLGFLVLAGLALLARRLLDHRADRQAMRELEKTQPPQVPVFTPEMIAGLPEPARRYFLYTIEPETRLSTVARISMAGHFGMGDKDNPNYLDFEATQVLAMPSGFVWKMRARRGLMRLSGSDSQRWSNANPEKKYRLQLFGGYLSEFRLFGGFRLPTHVEAGNHFDTDQYFPFFVADLSAVEFF